MAGRIAVVLPTPRNPVISVVLIGVGAG